MTFLVVFWFLLSCEVQFGLLTSYPDAILFLVLSVLKNRYSALAAIIVYYCFIVLFVLCQSPINSMSHWSSIGEIFVSFCRLFFDDFLNLQQSEFLKISCLFFKLCANAPIKLRVVNLLFAHRTAVA